MLKLFFIGTVDYKCLILIIGKMQLHSKGDIYSVFTRLFKNLEAPEICMAAVQQDGRALKYVPADVQLDNPEICIVALQQNWRALHYVPEAVKLHHPHICMAAVQQDISALQFVPEDVQLAHPNICIAAVQQDGWALQFVPEDVKLAHPNICITAVQQNGWALQRVPVSLKTNVEALAKLYTTSEQQLRSDLTLLQINDDLIEEVICSLKAPIAKSSSMIVDPLGTGKDSKQNHVESRGILPESGVLSIMQEYVHSPSKQENDASESNDFTNFTNS